MSLKLGIVFPETEEQFERHWKALGLAIWWSYKGQNPEHPFDLITAPRPYKVTAEISQVGN